MGEETANEPVSTTATSPEDEMKNYKVKVDHFDDIHMLGPDMIVEGAPNFRQIPGFPIFGCAQPTQEGIMRVLEKVPRGTEEKAVRTVWYNMRQEPVVYCDGLPCAPRRPDR